MNIAGHQNTVKNQRKPTQVGLSTALFALKLRDCGGEVACVIVSFQLQQQRGESDICLSAWRGEACVCGMHGVQSFSQVQTYTVTRTQSTESFVYYSCFL